MCLHRIFQGERKSKYKDHRIGVLGFEKLSVVGVECWGESNSGK